MRISLPFRVFLSRYIWPSHSIQISSPQRASCSKGTIFGIRSNILLAGTAERSGSSDAPVSGSFCGSLDIDGSSNEICESFQSRLFEDDSTSIMTAQVYCTFFPTTQQATGLTGIAQMQFPSPPHSQPRSESHRGFNFESHVVIPFFEEPSIG